MEAQADQATPKLSPAMDGGSFGRVWSGNPAFAIRTPWGPWTALLAAIAIAVLATGIAAILAGLGVIGGPGTISGDSVGIEMLGAWQALVILFTLMAAFAYGRPLSATLSLGPAPAGAAAYGQALAVLLAFQVVATGVEFVLIPDQMFRDLRHFVDLARGPYFVLGLIVIAVGAPLSEELLFRGFLLPALAKSRIGFAGASLLSTTLWTTLHLGYTVVGLVEVFLVGLLFSWLLWRTGSLRVTIVCHAVYNGLILVALRYLPLPASAFAG